MIIIHSDFFLSRWYRSILCHQCLNSLLAEFIWWNHNQDPSNFSPDFWPIRLRIVISKSNQRKFRVTIDSPDKHPHKDSYSCGFKKWEDRFQSAPQNQSHKWKFLHSQFSWPHFPSAKLAFPRQLISNATSCSRKPLFGMIILRFSFTSPKDSCVLARKTKRERWDELEKKRARQISLRYLQRQFILLDQKGQNYGRRTRNALVAMYEDSSFLPTAKDFRVTLLVD